MARRGRTRRRRRSPRRVFRRRRRRGRSRRGRRRGRGRGFLRNWGKISSALGGLAFFQQLTEKDMAGAANLDIASKAKLFINSVTGRLFGIGIAPDAPKFPQTFNFAGIFNKWSGLGAGLWAYGKISPVGPHRGKAGTLGKALLTGGILGGFFDAPEGQSTGFSSYKPALSHTARTSYHNTQTSVPMMSYSHNTRSSLR